MDWTKFKTFADDKSIIARMTISVFDQVENVFDQVENIVGKRENAGYHHFLLFPQCFQKAFPSE